MSRILQKNALNTITEHVINDEMLGTIAPKKTILLTIRKRQLDFLGLIMRNECLEYLINS